MRRDPSDEELAKLPSEELAERIRHGDKGAEGVLFRRYIKPPVRWLCDEGFLLADAEDIVADALIEMLERLRHEDVTIHKTFEAWVRRFMRYRMQQAWQKRRRSRELLSATSDDHHEATRIVRVAEADHPDARLRTEQMADRLSSRLTAGEGKVVAAHLSRDDDDVEPKSASERALLSKAKRKCLEMAGDAPSENENLKEVTSCTRPSSDRTSSTPSMIPAGRSATAPELSSPKSGPPGSSREFNVVSIKREPKRQASSPGAAATPSHRSTGLDVIAAVQRLKGQAEKGFPMNTISARWLEECVVRSIERSSECARLRQHVETHTGPACAETFTATFEAIGELWTAVWRDAGITPFSDLNNSLDRAANRVNDALKRAGATLSSSDKDAMRVAVGEMLQRLLRTAMAEQASTDQAGAPHSGLSDDLATNRYAFMQYGVRRGRAFSITRIMTVLKLTFAQARQRVKRGQFSDDDLALLLELPVSAIATLWSPNPSATALNQLLKHTGYRDIALKMRLDATAADTTAVAASTTERVERAEIDSPEIDADFAELAAKYKNSTDFHND